MRHPHNILHRVNCGHRMFGHLENDYGCDNNMDECWKVTPIMDREASSGNFSTCNMQVEFLK